jgi:hypothetical protein
MSNHHQAGVQLAVQVQHQPIDLVRGAAIEITGRFIGEHAQRAGHQGPAHRRTLPFTTGKFPWLVLQTMP